MDVGVNRAAESICREGLEYSGAGALSRDRVPIQNQPCLCPELPLYPRYKSQARNTTGFCVMSHIWSLEYPILVIFEAL